MKLATIKSANFSVWSRLKIENYQIGYGADQICSVHNVLRSAGFSQHKIT